jgi:hypothetical protein
MKAKDFGQFLETFAAMLGEAGAIDQAGAWRAISRIFQVKPAAKVSDVCKALVGIHVATRDNGTMVRNVTALIPSLRRCLGESAKKALIDDLERFASVLAPYARFLVSDFADAAAAQLSRAPAPTPGTLSADVVANYLRLLEESLNDEKVFLEIFNRLKKDSAVKTPEAKQLARAFAKASGKSKKEALDRIWGRHASLIGVGARAKATGGRTAA